MKIDLYRRIVRISNDKELEEVGNEMIDRFGKPPQEVRRLLTHAQIRAAAYQYRIRKICLETEFFKEGTCYFLVLEFVSHNLIEELKKKTGLPIRTTDEMKAYIPLPTSIIDFGKSPDKMLDFVHGLFKHAGKT
jgi:transcription-repair coupling factor (superfamily II helicase)